jgi:hypothetical protein
MGSTVSGKMKTAVDELMGIANQIAKEGDGVKDQLDVLGKPTVAQPDFGKDYGKQGDAFLNAFKASVVVVVQKYADATHTVAKNVTDTAKTQGTNEDQQAASLNHIQA